MCGSKGSVLTGTHPVHVFACKACSVEKKEREKKGGKEGVRKAGEVKGERKESL